MQTSVLMSGIGGQGIQVASKLLCLAAIPAGFKAQQFSVYGGAVRGGLCECSVTVANEPITEPPVLHACDAAICMHPYAVARNVPGKVRRGGLVIVNTSLIEAGTVRPEGVRVVEIAASTIALEIGNLMTAMMVVTGAYATLIGAFDPQNLIDRVPEIIPPYRQQHVALNQKAIQAGIDFARNLTAVPA